MNAAEGQLLSCGSTFGSVLDPSTPRGQANRPKYGTGKWTRVRIDATRSWEFERKIQARWSEYGIGLPYLSEERREQLTFEKLRRVLPPAMRRAAEDP